MDNEVCVTRNITLYKNFRIFFFVGGFFKYYILLPCVWFVQFCRNITLFALFMNEQAGVKNGMFMGPAKKLCPDLQTIPYNFDGYQEVSQILYDTVLR